MTGTGSDESPSDSPYLQDHRQVPPLVYTDSSILATLYSVRIQLLARHPATCAQRVLPDFMPKKVCALYMPAAEDSIEIGTHLRKDSRYPCDAGSAKYPATSSGSTRCITGTSPI
jgi:hypothetical protein